MNTQKFIPKMTGFKATNAEMKCQGFQYELGKWYEHEGPIELCKSGFHFCIHPSGPWNYYPETGIRIFKVEVEQVLDIPVQPGSDFKLVAKRIRLIEEITPGSKTKENTGHGNTGDGNTGNRNTGDCNTGDWNTGNRNTGDCNTGDCNTGDWNTGDGNTGNRNTGDCNTGDCNTGDCNTGDRNTGDRNTGHGNTGDGNTGDRNTGHGNATNYSSGYFCQKEVCVKCFDIQTKLTRKQFMERYPEFEELSHLLQDPKPIYFQKFKRLPGITKAKLATLHRKHIAARKIEATS